MFAEFRCVQNPRRSVRVRPRRSNYNWEYEEGTVSEHTFVSGAGRNNDYTRFTRLGALVGVGMFFAAPDQKVDGVRRLMPHDPDANVAWASLTKITERRPFEEERRSGLVRCTA